MKDRHVDGEALRQLRIRHQLPQKLVAERANVSVWHLSDVERGKAYCGDMLAYRLAKIYDCDPQDFTRDGPHPNRDTFRHVERKTDTKDIDDEEGAA